MMATNIDMPPSVILELLKVLVSPGKAAVSSLTEEEKFDQVLRNNITSVTSLMTSDSFTSHKDSIDHIFKLVTEKYGASSSLDDDDRSTARDIRWDFVKCNLKLLLALKLTMEEAVKRAKSEDSLSKVKRTEYTAPPLAADALSISHQKHVMTSAQFVACMGMCPSFHPGVGIPVELRSGFGKVLKTGSVTLTAIEREHRLWFCVKAILACTQQSSLGGVLLSRHLGDVLAGLIQICHGPKPKVPTSTSDDSAGSDRLLSVSDRTEASEDLEKLCTRVFQPVLVRELMLLQGGAGPQHTGGKQTSAPPPCRPSPWLRRACGRLLSECLLRPGGVSSVLKCLLDGGGGSVEVGWKKCDAAAKILANCPGKAESKEEYYKLLAPQMLRLLSVEDKQSLPLYVRTVSRTLALMMENDAEVAHTWLIRPLMAPLLGCVGDESNFPQNSEPMVLVTEADVDRTISNLHKVYVAGSEPQSRLTATLAPLVQVIFKIYAFSLQGVSPSRSPTEDLLSTFLKHQDSAQSVSVLQSFAISVRPSSDSVACRQLSDRVALTPGGEGGVAVMLLPSDSCPPVLEGWESLAGAVTSLIQTLGDEVITAELFLLCLTHLTQMISEEIADDQQPSSEPLEGSDPEMFAMRKLKENLTVLALLEKMCTTFGPECLKKASHILEFAKVTLDRCVQVLDNTDDVGMGLFESETVTLALGLVTSALGGEVEISEDDREKSKELLPLLQRIEEAHPDMIVQQLSAELRIAIATHGRVTTQSSAQRHQPPKVTTPEQSRKQPLVEVISSTDNKTSKFDENDSSNKSTRAEMSYQKALEELKDPLLPVRAHALIALKRLIENKDSETLQNVDSVLDIFLANVKHRDSYIYLAAIQGLASLAYKDTDRIVTALVDEYSGGKTLSGIEQSPEVRMKIGEVLVKATKSLGEMAPKYRDILLHGFLRGATDSDGHLRASSLSNLGEICKLLRYALGNNIYEIMECVGALLRSDQVVEVRRSAAMVTTLLLRGLGKHSLQVLGQALNNLHRLLKLQMKIEHDDTVKLHMTLSLEELDSIMTDFLFPKQLLEKKIHVLSAP